MLTLQCEMCGKEGQLFKADIEGAELLVCSDCARFGRIISKVKSTLSVENDEHNAAFLGFKNSQKGMNNAFKNTVKDAAPEADEVVVDDYSQIIKRAREKLGLKQEEVARKIAEKESIIHKVESNQFVPSIELARKFEKALNVKLIQEDVDKCDISIEKGCFSPMTLGDLVNIKK